MKRNRLLIVSMLLVFLVGNIACQPKSIQKDSVLNINILPDQQTGKNYLPNPVGWVNDFENIYTDDEIQKLMAAPEKWRLVPSCI